MTPSFGKSRCQFPRTRDACDRAILRTSARVSDHLQSRWHVEGSSKEPGSTYRTRAQRSGAPNRNRANQNDIQANSLLLCPHGMAQYDYEYDYEYDYDYEHEQFLYGTVKLCQSPGKAGGFLGKIKDWLDQKRGKQPYWPPLPDRQCAEVKYGRGIFLH